MSKLQERQTEVYREWLASPEAPFERWKSPLDVVSKGQDAFIQAFGYKCGGTGAGDKFWQSPQVKSLNSIQLEIVKLLYAAFSTEKDTFTLAEISTATILQAVWNESKGSIHAQSDKVLTEHLKDLIRLTLVTKTKRGYRLNTKKWMPGLKTKLPPLKCSQKGYKGRTKDSLLAEILTAINKVQEANGYPPLELSDITRYDRGRAIAPPNYQFLGIDKDGDYVYRGHPPILILNKQGTEVRKL